MYHQLATQPAIEQISADTWAKLSQQKIWFAHASVGANIIQGVQSLQQENPEIQLNIVANETPWTTQTPGLIHFSSLPGSGQSSNTVIDKIDHFAQIMQSSVGHQVDIALFKLCWADIHSDTDVPQAFSYYEQAMTRLIQNFPNTTFVQVTIPLVAEPSNIVLLQLTLKNWVKQILGRPLFHLSDNVKINQFNELLRSHYRGQLPIFDLAQIESTFPDGRRQTFIQDNQQYFSLVSEYTDDMGHLNSMGQRVVAEQFLTFLANNAAL